MADRSKIEWTDATWNPVRGCTRVSPGCGGPGKQGGCYAEAIAGARFSDPGQPFHGFAERTSHGGRWTGKVGLVESALTIPLRWKKPRKIFVNSMSDLFHEKLTDEDIDRIFAVMAMCPQHTLQALTKRSARMRKYVSAPGRRDAIINAMYASGAQFGAIPWPLPQVWLGVSVEDQARADERRDDLATLAALGWATFVSYEPALGPVDWTGWEFLRQLISGGESGSHARPSHSDWHRAARDFCAARGIAYFFKQWGEWAPCWYRDDGEPRRSCTFDGVTMFRVGKASAGRLLDGHEHNDMPGPSR